eukprot:574173-Pleurochrysis_carterae.AAC.4
MHAALRRAIKARRRTLQATCTHYKALKSLYQCIVTIMCMSWISRFAWRAQDRRRHVISEHENMAHPATRIAWAAAAAACRLCEASARSYQGTSTRGIDICWPRRRDRGGRLSRTLGAS